MACRTHSEHGLASPQEYKFTTRKQETVVYSSAYPKLIGPKAEYGNLLELSGEKPDHFQKKGKESSAIMHHVTFKTE